MLLDKNGGHEKNNSSVFWTNFQHKCFKWQNIYVTKVPTIANINVYVVSTPTNADLIVYKAPSPIYPGVNENTGIWYFVNNQTMADETIYYVETPTIADLKIYFTNIPTQAGWQNDKKKNLIKN